MPEAGTAKTGVGGKWTNTTPLIVVFPVHRREGGDAGGDKEGKEGKEGAESGNGENGGAGGDGKGRTPHLSLWYFPCIGRREATREEKRGWEGNEGRTPHLSSRYSPRIEGMEATQEEKRRVPEAREKEERHASHRGLSRA